MGAGKRFSSLIQSDLHMSGRRIPGFMFVRGLRMDFGESWAARGPAAPKSSARLFPKGRLSEAWSYLPTTMAFRTRPEFSKQIEASVSTHRHTKRDGAISTLVVLCGCH